MTKKKKKKEKKGLTQCLFPGRHSAIANKGREVYQATLCSMIEDNRCYAYNTKGKKTVSPQTIGVKAIKNKLTAKEEVLYNVFVEAGLGLP